MLHIPIHSQPDDETCGPTCLHAVYNYFDFDLSLEQVISSLKKVKSGGTLSAHIAHHALKNGLTVTLYVYNLNLFDPTWFHKRSGEAETDLLIDKLNKQLKYFKSHRDFEATTAYIEMLEAGGKIKFKDLNNRLLNELFNLKVPIITGLSSTFLYRSARERYNIRTKESIYDDIRGDPCGHFVVLCGMDQTKRKVVIADPYRTNPLSHDNYYHVNKMRLVNAILLGVLTYDANLLVIDKP